MKKAGVLFLMTLLFFTTVRSALKAAVSPVLITEDVGNGYRYEFPGIGGFSSNAKVNEKVSVAVITLDEGLSGKLYKGKNKVEFTPGSPILEPGKYELRVFRSETSGEYGSYKFTVENDYDLQGKKREIKLVENPEMKVDYNEKNGYTYTLPNGKSFYTTVPIGGISNTQVIVKTETGINLYSVRKDGKLVQVKEPLSFYETGTYELVLRSNELGFDGDESYKITLSFRILSETKPQFINYLRAPMGFLLDRIVVDGVEKKPDNAAFTELKKDGNYEVVFRGEKRGDIVYTCRFLRDTTPPGVKFSDDVNDGIVSHPVKYSGREADIKLELYKNFKSVHASENLISQNGNYILVASDEAGNERRYSFTVHKELVIPGDILAGTVLVVLLAIGILLFYFRRKPNVR